MSLVPKHIKELKPYIPGKSKQDFKNKYGNKNSIKLASNENPLGCSPKSIERVQLHINNCYRYPDSSGFKLREKLSVRYSLGMNVSNMKNMTLIITVNYGKPDITFQFIKSIPAQKNIEL